VVAFPPDCRLPSRGRQRTSVPPVRHPIKILVVALQAVTRDAVRALCERTEDLSFAGAATSLDEALNSEASADVLLVDVIGTDVDRQLPAETANRRGTLRLVVLVERPELLPLTFGRGADWALPKSASVDQIVHAIRLVARGKRGPTPRSTAIPSLTPRERDVLTRLARGWTNNEIATALGISIRTVATHISTIYRKLEVSDRVDAARRGLEMGLGAETDVAGDPPGNGPRGDT
jgi:two-component system, NarL family, nitrate/nitrite response regulator NarL